jgi:hypothetical protein
MTELQRVTFSKYIRTTSASKSKNGSLRYMYICNRSAHRTQQSTATGKRSLKKQGSIKSKKVCTTPTTLETDDEIISKLLLKDNILKQ